MNDTLYKEEILEHYRFPLHFGKPAMYDASSRQLNPFCGDEVEIFIACSGENISNISFIGKGCVISIAAASILTDYVKGKTKKELTKFSEKDMLALLGIEVSETRKKCAFLPLSVLKDLLPYAV